jgi:hypothetical protein
LLVQIGQHSRQKSVDAPQEVGLWDPIFEPKLIKQTCLINPLSAHHDPPPTPSRQKTESLFVDTRKPFFDSIGHSRPSQMGLPADRRPLCPKNGLSRLAANDMQVVLRSIAGP